MKQHEIYGQYEYMYEMPQGSGPEIYRRDECCHSKYNHMMCADIIDGSVNIDANSDERGQCTNALNNLFNTLRPEQNRQFGDDIFRFIFLKDIL